MKIVRRLVVALLVLMCAVGVGFAAWVFQDWDTTKYMDEQVPGEFAPAPGVATNAPGQTSDQLMEWSQRWAPQLGFSARALRAYGNAEQTLKQTMPACHLRWTTLAGIAFIESQHGTYGGAEVFADGTTSQKIRGVQLDGTNNTQRIQDTDRGVLDGNSHYDVAMGPFQFIPETWRHFGVDANGDGRVSPDNIDDAAVAVGRYLCFNGRDLLVPREWQRAILSYNRAMTYVKAVYRSAYAYGEGRQPRWDYLAAQF
ncbi:lytic transglycosylase domain-containing protein [Lawsonella clevelandensis]|uniref:lytic transglycosylase domain-containing protein n=1 Tax=Lawsonella clevelandensis TaxID=1528099 RepID=UPI0032D98D8D